MKVQQIAVFYGSTASTLNGLEKFLKTKTALQTAAEAEAAMLAKKKADDDAANERFAAWLAKNKKAIAALPKYARYFFVKRESRYFSGSVLTATLARLKKQAGSQDDEKILEAVRRRSFNAADFGRLRKTYEGSLAWNCKGIRTETNGKWGWDKVSWHYADYFFCIAPDRSAYFWKLADGTQGETKT